MMRDYRDDLILKSSVSEMIVSSAIVWSTIYVIVKQVTRQPPEWAVRVVTALHATFITMLSILDWYYINEWNIEKLGEPSTKFQETLLSITLGYFCFDLLWMIKYGSEGPAMYYHHISSIICLVFILACEASGSEVLVGISGLEITNPCLQIRWFLRSHGYQGTMIHIFTEIIFMVAFIVFRIFYGSYLTYHIVLHPKCYLILKAGTISLYCISWVFVYQMFSYIFKKYLKFERKPETNTAQK